MSSAINLYSVCERPKRKLVSFILSGDLTLNIAYLLCKWGHPVATKRKSSKQSLVLFMQIQIPLSKLVDRYLWNMLPGGLASQREARVVGVWPGHFYITSQTGRLFSLWITRCGSALSSTEASADRTQWAVSWGNWNQGDRNNMACVKNHKWVNTVCGKLSEHMKNYCLRP